MKKVMIGLLLCSLVITILSGCRVNISIGTNDTLTSETYPDAEKYQISSFTYNAAGIKAVEVYWRSGEVEITESDNSELHIKESGGELPEDTAMHYLLDDGVLRIRFCKSGAKIQVNAADKHLSLEVPKGIDLSVHTTSALVKADIGFIVLCENIRSGRICRNPVQQLHASVNHRMVQCVRPAAKIITDFTSIDFEVAKLSRRCTAWYGKPAFCTLLYAGFAYQPSVQRQILHVDVKYSTVLTSKSGF